MTKPIFLKNGTLNYPSGGCNPRYTYLMWSLTQNTNSDNRILVSFNEIDNRAPQSLVYTTPVSHTTLKELLKTDDPSLFIFMRKSGYCWLELNSDLRALCLCVRENIIPQLVQIIQQTEQPNTSFFSAVIKMLHEFNQRDDDSFLIPVHPAHEPIAAGYPSAKSAVVQSDELFPEMTEQSPSNPLNPSHSDQFNGSFSVIDSSTHEDEMNLSENYVQLSQGPRESLPSIEERSSPNSMGPRLFSLPNHSDNSRSIKHNGSQSCCTVS